MSALTNSETLQWRLQRHRRCSVTFQHCIATLLLCVWRLERRGNVVAMDPAVLEEMLRQTTLERDYSAIRGHTHVLGDHGADFEQYLNPYGVCLTPDGGVAVCDFNNDHVLIVYRDSRPPRVLVQCRRPVGICMHDSDFIVVGSGRVRRVCNDGTVRWTAFGGMFDEDIIPYGVAVLHTGIIVVSDEFHRRLKLLRHDGTIVGNLALPETGSDFRSVRPLGLAVDNTGNIVIADGENSRVMVITPTGQLVRTLGSHSSGLGQMDPANVAVDHANNILVADFYNSRVVVFNEAGDATHFMTSTAPRGICVDADSNVVVSKHDGRVLVY